MKVKILVMEMSMMYWTLGHLFCLILSKSSHILKRALILPSAFLILYFHRFSKRNTISSMSCSLSTQSSQYLYDWHMERWCQGLWYVLVFICEIHLALVQIPELFSNLRVRKNIYREILLLNNVFRNIREYFEN